MPATLLQLGQVGVIPAVQTGSPAFVTGSKTLAKVFVFPSRSPLLGSRFLLLEPGAVPGEGPPPAEALALFCSPRPPRCEIRGLSPLGGRAVDSPPPRRGSRAAQDGCPAAPEPRLCPQSPGLRSLQAWALEGPRGAQPMGKDPREDFVEQN